MTLRTWRLVTWKHRESAFSGEGSRLYGGRWNTPGNPVVYLCDSQALCALENIVHFESGMMPAQYAFFPVEFDSSLVQPLQAKLPPNWRIMPEVTAEIGDAWLASHNSGCILAIPSTLVTEGTNYLINPRHPETRNIKIGTPLPYSFDERINALAAGRIGSTKNNP